MAPHVLRQCAGIDCDQKHLVIHLVRLLFNQDSEVIRSKKFKNNLSGIKALYKWALKHSSEEVELTFVVEATGVYHQALAYYLADNDAYISVVLPSKTSNYMKTQQLKTINDDTASRSISEFGLRHRLERWFKPDPELLILRNLMRERDDLIKQRTVLSNQLHANTIAQGVSTSVIKRNEQITELIDKHVYEIEREADQLVKSMLQRVLGP